jgi:hypothetical protein
MSQRLFPIVMALGLLTTVSSAQERVVMDGPDEMSVPLYAAAVDGSVTLTRNGQADALAENTLLLPGDRVRVAAGRAELRSDRGYSLFLDEATVLDVASERSVRLASGAARLVLGDAADVVTGAPRIDAPNASARALAPVDFTVRVSVGLRADETELRVRDGSAELSADRGAVVVSAGESSVVGVTLTPSMPVAYEVGGGAFDQWVDDRLGLTRPTASASYMPPELASYSAVLDQHGSWQSEPEYGYVWYPSVAATWRPYAYGAWGHAGYYGWTWVGQGPWAWPTHHYGRWGWHANRWFWIPGAAWGPAWVSWGIGPGYVGWCPLGWNNAPVFSFWVGGSYYGGGYYGGAYSRPYGPHDPGHGWTVVPRQHFRPGVAVGHHSVAYRNLTHDQRGAFVMQRTPPSYRGQPGSGGTGRRDAPQAHYAVPRNGARSAAGRGPGSGSGLNQGIPPTGPRAAVTPGGITAPGARAYAPGVGSAQPRARWPGQAAQPGLRVPAGAGSTSHGVGGATPAPSRHGAIPRDGAPGAGLGPASSGVPEVHRGTPVPSRQPYGVPRYGAPGSALGSADRRAPQVQRGTPLPTPQPYGGSRAGAPSSGHGASDRGAPQVYRGTPMPTQQPRAMPRGGGGGGDAPRGAPPRSMGGGGLPSHGGAPPAGRPAPSSGGGGGHAVPRSGPRPR